MKTLSIIALAVSILFGVPRALTQAPPRTPLSGQVTDPSGALVPRAAVHLTPSDGTPASDTVTDSRGHFSVLLPPGNYNMRVTAPGFDPFLEAIRLDGAPANVSAQLLIPAEQDVVDVDAADDKLSTSGDANKNGIDLTGDGLAMLSSDDATFQQQLIALAGDDGSHLPHIYIDGFSGSTFPPKSAIREVRINHNPFSAAYDSMGLGRIEIMTKPGTGTLHGSVDTYGDPSAFNSRNPFLQQEEPAYYRLHTVGTLSGPLGSRTSFFLTGDYYDQQNNAVINAQSVDNSGAIYSISEAVPDPTTTGQYTARLDRQWAGNNTLSARYEYDRVSQANGDLTQSVLPSGADNSLLSTAALQLSNTHMAGANTVLDSRFQWVRTRMKQAPVSSAPTIQVSGTVTDGGSPTQLNDDHQDQLEFQQDAVSQHGKHLIRLGARYRLYRDANLSTAGFNGTYTFSDLASYQASILGTPSASQYQVTLGRSAFAVTTGDLAAWAEDEWQPRKNLTVDLGARFESQSGIPDHADPSPHVGVSWAPFQGGRKSSFVVLRVGSGIYYDRFSIANLMTAARQGNPLLEQTYTVTSPDFFSSSAPAPSPSWEITTYRVAPDLRSEYEIDSSAGAEFSLGKKGSVAVTFLNKLQRRQWVSINANAPRADGTRPFGIAAGNMYQFVSGADGMGNWFIVDPRFRLGRSLAVTAHFNFKHQTADTFGISYFASNSYDIHQDYGRSPSDRPHAAYVGVNDVLPWGLSAGFFLTARAGEPFNITTGADNNGDSIYNDRPSYASAASRPADVVHTVYGNLDLQPQPGERIIPVNLGHSAGPFFSMQVQASKTWQFGLRPANQDAAKAAAAKPDLRYALVFSVEAQNITNTVSPAPPVGALTSPFFGQSIATSNNFLSTSAANRTVTLHMAFTF